MENRDKYIKRSIRLPIDIHRELEEVARENDISVNKLIIMIMEEYLWE
jgi:predicted HicB family RNase H-like nuclease